MPAEAKDIAPAWKEHGWLVPYLEMGDQIYGVGRLHWWLEGIYHGRLPKGEIPQLEFQHGSSTEVREGMPVFQPTRKGDKNPPLSAQGARRHLEDLVAKMGSGWESMLYLIRWLHWGLGLASNLNTAPKSPYDSNWGDMLYKKFQLGRLQAADADVLGDIIAENKGAGFNPNGFYPTPMSVCTMMAMMTMGDSNEFIEQVEEKDIQKPNNRMLGMDRSNSPDNRLRSNISGKQDQQHAQNGDNTSCDVDCHERCYPPGFMRSSSLRQSDLYQSKAFISGDPSRQRSGYDKKGKTASPKRGEPFIGKTNDDIGPADQGKQPLVTGSGKGVRCFPYDNSENQKRGTVDRRLMSVCDPCVGTGRMLLAASNYSLNLYGMDIDRTMVEACSINMAIFAPWAVYIPRNIGILMGRNYEADSDPNAIASMNDARVEQGHSDALPEDKRIIFDRHGQGNLFSVLQGEDLKGKE